MRWLLPLMWLAMVCCPDSLARAQQGGKADAAVGPAVSVMDGGVAETSTAAAPTPGEQASTEQAGGADAGPGADTASQRKVPADAKSAKSSAEPRPASPALSGGQDLPATSSPAAPQSQPDSAEPAAESSSQAAGSTPADAGSARRAAAEREASVKQRRVQVAALEQRAGALHALVAGDLDPQTDIDGLLRFDLLQGAELGELLAADGPLADGPEVSARVQRARLVSAAAAAKAESDNEQAEPLVRAQAQLRLALIEFLRLSPSQRQQRIEDHSKKRAAYQQAVATNQRLRTEKSALAARFDQAQAYLNGDLATDAELTGLLVLDLAPAVPTPQPVPRSGRRTAKKKSVSPTLDPALVAEREQLEQDIAELREGLAALARDYAGLNSEQREALANAHRLRQQAQRHRELAEAAAQQAHASEAGEAQDSLLAAQHEVHVVDAELATAEAQQQEALRSAERARTEAQRMLAAEKARVLGRKAELSKLRLQLAEEMVPLQADYDKALGLVTQARELQGRSVLDRGREGEASALYERLRIALLGYRERLSGALGAIIGHRSRLPEPLSPLDTKFVQQVGDAELSQLWDELQQQRSKVELYESQLLWSRAEKLREAVVRLNDSRLALLPLVSESLRAQVAGFGPKGVMQAHSELNHMLLMIRYHVISLPRNLASLGQQLAKASIMIVFSLLEIVLLIALYRLYRRRAGPFLQRVYRQTVSTRNANGGSRVQAKVLWYLWRLHRPLGAWAFTAALFRQLEGTSLGLPEVDFIWIILLWFYAGWTAVLAVDAFAARQSRLMQNWHDNSSLRIRSLRLLALVFLGSGLALSLTERSLGQGTLYSWTQTVAWLALLPVSLLLAWWWRPRVRTYLAEIREPSSLLQWARAHIDGSYGLLVSGVVGVQWVMAGGTRMLIRGLSGFESSERITAYLFRNQVQKTTDAVVREHKDDTPVSADAYPELNPQLPDSGPLPVAVPGIAERAMAALRARGSQVGSLVLVVGERGLGKTTVLRQLAEEQPEGAGLLLPGAGSVAHLHAELARRLELPEEAATVELVKALSARGIRLLLLDDLQQLVRPTVLGLREYDHWVEWLRELRKVVAVAVSCDAPAYAVLARGRSRLGIDEVVTLAPWSREQIAQLVRSRCAAAGIEPAFDELVIPRAFDLEVEQQSNPLESGYFRILWDYSDGNPAVALLYFRRSLVKDKQGRLRVRLFVAPASMELDGLPPQLPFVLRTLMLLSEGDVPTVAACVNLSLPVTRDCMELGLRRGYLEPIGSRMRISLSWFRAAKITLRRQHLLS